MSGILRNVPHNGQKKKDMNLEKKSSKVLKFAPVKLLVIESRGEYYRAVVCAICVGFSHLLIGATVMATFMYSLQSGDIHAVLCTLGYHFFSAEAILCLNFVNGWSAPLRSKHRKCAHIILQSIGIICVAFGVACITSPNVVISSGHSITGFVTAFLTLLCILTGPLGLHSIPHIAYVHIGFGLSTLIMSSVCLCLGFYTKQYVDWAGDIIVYILTTFVTICTVCICTITIMNCVWTHK